MGNLSAGQLLAVWERGLDQSPLERALSLLVAACPEEAPEQLARLSLGQRDARLLSLREETLGCQLEALAECPHCRDRLELTCNTVDLRLTPEIPVTEERLYLNFNDWEVEFRLPDSLDLATIEGQPDRESARLCLMGRCLLATRRSGQAIPQQELSPEVIAAVTEKMAEADPQADLHLDLTCPSCGHQWQAPFDIASFFWRELDAWARRTLREVHLLASAYGWREADILALSPRRRYLYLEAIGS